MQNQARKCLQNKPIVRKFPKKDKNVCFNWLAYCNYGINAKKASIIVNELNLKTLTDLQKLTIEDLTQIKGIGKYTAKTIIEGIHGSQD
jgi:ribosomal protein S13